MEGACVVFSLTNVWLVLTNCILCTNLMVARRHHGYTVYSVVSTWPPTDVVWSDACYVLEHIL